MTNSIEFCQKKKKTKQKKTKKNNKETKKRMGHRIYLG